MEILQKANLDQPENDQLEISLFGPSYGECIVVHYGNGKWLTIDSCLEDDRSTPAAISYFNEIGVDLSNITHVIVTHPDGDHIGGIGKLLSACADSTLVVSSVLSDRQMVAYTTYYAQSDTSSLTQTTKELYDILNESLKRHPYTPKYVLQDTLIIENDFVKITALSPSSSKINNFLARVSQNLPQKNTNRIVPASLTPNAVSLVILVEVDGFSAILGADLEEHPGRGWTEIMNNSITYSNAPGCILLKIPHHGSSNADCPAFWNSMKGATAILAPFKRGNVQLPTQLDVERILNYTNNAFSTTRFSTQSKVKDHNVDKTLKEHGIQRKQLFPKLGHLRFRVKVHNVAQLALFKNAVHLSMVNSTEHVH